MNGSLVMPEQCPLCQSNVYLYDNNTIYNAYIGRYSNSKCRKYIYLRFNTFYDYFPKTSISIIRNIISLSLQEEKNDSQIYETTKKNYNISQKLIHELLEY